MPLSNPPRTSLASLSAAVFAAALSLAAGAAPASAQLTGQNTAPGGSTAPTLIETTRLVIEDVVVKDKSGKPIDGLTAKDFTVTEDGIPQTIKYLEHQVIPDAASPLPPAPAGGEDIKIYNRLARTQITTEKPGEVLYKDHRLLALYFDMSAMPPTDQLRALTAAEKFVRTNMTAADLVSIMRYAGSSVDVLQDFTSDRNRILSILETMVVGEGQGDAESSSGDASAADTGAAFGQDDAEFNIFTTDRQLSALQTAAETLEHLNEKKELIYFASGLNLNGLDNQAQLHATEESALKAGVAFWPIDARGLVAQGPMGDATHGSPGGSAMYTGASAMTTASNFARSQDTLYALGGDTGGKALLDSNDLTQGIINAQRAESNYYILAYVTTNLTKNGKFRKVKVELTPQQDAKLDFRLGYYADKEFDKFTTADKERQLEDALALGDPMTELTIGLEVNYFQFDRAEYFVPVMIKIPGSELALAKKRGAESTTIDFVGEIKDDFGGATQTNIRDFVVAKLSDATAAELARRPLEYYSGYTLLPGKYTIKVLARDDVTGKIGTFQTSFVIPNLNKELARVPISSVVLSGQRIDLKDAIYNVANQKEQNKEAASDPLVQNGAKLIPSVTRVFSKGRNFYVYLQAYEPATAPSQPLVAFVSFYKGATKVYETQPIEVTPPANPHLQIAPMNFTIDLNQLPPGQYNCQVTVLDPTGQKGTFWQAPIMLVP